MQNLHKLIGQLPELRQLQSYRTQGPALGVGLSRVQKAALIYTLSGQQEGAQGIFVITPDEPAAVRMTEDLNRFFGASTARHYPARDYTFRRVEGVSHEYEHARLQALSAIAGGSCKLVVASAEAACQYTIPPAKLAAGSVILRPGQKIATAALAQILVEAGYSRADQVEGHSQFAIRGGIVDIFPPAATAPFRLEFWDDEIDTISTFSPTTQRREDTVKKIAITPAREVLLPKEALLALLQEATTTQRGKNAPEICREIQRDIDALASGLTLLCTDKYLPIIYPQPATLLDYITTQTLIYSEPAAIKEALRTHGIIHHEDITTLLTEHLLPRGCDCFYQDYPYLQAKAQAHKALLLDSFARQGDIPLAGTVQIQTGELSPWGGDLALLKEDLQELLALHYCVVLLAGTQRGAQVLATDLAEDGLPAAYCEEIEAWQQNKILVCQGSLAAGFTMPTARLAVLTGVNTGPRKKQKLRHQDKEKAAKLQNISDLSPGDYVVHISHGIGIFEGILKKEVQGVVKDYIKIKYGGTDTLFVPVTQLDLVSKYIGGGGGEGAVRLSRLNSGEWSKTRQRVKKAVSDMAKELIALYAKRLTLKGYAFEGDSDWQRDFEDRFPYTETDDQLRCVREIKADMQSHTPMDRLLCGDVGFGKTEVAIRGAFKCVLESKQCALLVPTTILAWQHYQTFQRRMEGFPIKIELLSRFRTAKQQAEILRQLKRGEIDVLIGTHRILQKDVEFKDLGLCIIDEEQRFGVAHKERFKELRGNVDVLTLSATPIPRTLNMAMSGIRDMSLIEEAPQDRHPVQTYVLEYDEGVVLDAIKKELRRGGQVFYLFNRVAGIESCAAKLQKHLPDAVIATAHGRMGEENLSKVWKGLMDKEIDVLVCTTIIESGVDVSNCNTLIVEHADCMGLSQLYQLRGRVGRSERRAFAYLTFHRGKLLTEIAEKRLGAIKEFTSFGSGFRIAMRDLEIRGAGDILGSQQHGHMEAVGYDLYLRLLSEAVSEEKGQPVQRAAECTVDIQTPAHIPETYISDLPQRIDIYKKIAAIATQEDKLDVIDELIDRFGEPPASVLGLTDVALLRGMAAALGIEEISQNGQTVLLYPQQINMPAAAALAHGLKGRVMVNAGKKPYIAVKFAKGQQATQAIEEALTIMAAAPQPQASPQQQ